MVEVWRISALQSQKQERPGPRGGGSGLVSRHYRETRSRVPVLAHHLVALDGYPPMYWVLVIRPNAAASCSTLWGAHAAARRLLYRDWRVGYFPPGHPRP